MRWATPNAAAWRASTPSGIRVNDVAVTTTSSANAPTIVLPKTRSPTATLRTSSATSRTSPANSLPGMNGTGTESWYSSAIKRTSGKLTAAAATRTRAVPASVLGDGTSRISTTSGGP